MQKQKELRKRLNQTCDNLKTLEDKLDKIIRDYLLVSCNDS